MEINKTLPIQEKEKSYFLVDIAEAIEKKDLDKLKIIIKAIDSILRDSMNLSDYEIGGAEEDAINKVLSDLIESLSKRDKGAISLVSIAGTSLVLRIGKDFEGVFVCEPADESEPEGVKAWNHLVK
jgi:hypothetical protein